MKELGLQKSQKDEVEVHAQKQIEKQHKFLGTHRAIKGLNLYEINTETLQVSQAEFEPLTVVFSEDQSNQTKKRKVIVKPNCYYVQAINKYVAVKKYKKLLVRTLFKQANL